MRCLFCFRFFSLLFLHSLPLSLSQPFLSACFKPNFRFFKHLSCQSLHISAISSRTCHVLFVFRRWTLIIQHTSLLALSLSLSLSLSQSHFDMHNLCVHQLIADTVTTLQYDIFLSFFYCCCLACRLSITIVALLIQQYLACPANCFTGLVYACPSLSLSLSFALFVCVCVGHSVWQPTEPL